MKASAPKSNKVLIRAYNVAQALHNVYIFKGLWELKDQWWNITSGVDQSFHAAFEHYFFHFMLNKYADLIGSFFFAFAKKNDHLSFFYLYHHSTIVIAHGIIITWGGPELYALVAWGLAFNAFVHIVMYVYYFFSTFGMFRRYRFLVTTLQILQFVVLIYQHFKHILSFSFVFDTSGSKIVICTCIYYIISLVLFINFLIMGLSKMLSKMIIQCVCLEAQIEPYLRDNPDSLSYVGAPPITLRSSISRRTRSKTKKVD